MDQTAYLCKVAWGLGVQEMDIEDAVQEARLAIWLAPAQRDWRYVARNRMIDCARQWYGRKKRGHMTNDYLGVKRNHLPIEDVQVEAPDQYVEVENRLVFAELMKRVRLTDRQEFVIKRLWRGMQRGEIANELQVTLERVYQLKTRALQKLQAVA